MTVDIREEDLRPPEEGGDDEGAPQGEPVAAATPRRSRVLLAALVFTLVAAVFLAGSALVWWRADHDSSLTRAQTRDVVLIDAQRDVEVLSTLDYRAVPAGLDRWRAVSTGDLAKQLGTVDDAARQALVDAAKVSTGKVIDAALTALDVKAGTASAIATVEISVRDQTGHTTVKRDRFTLGMTRVHHQWLVSRLNQLPVGLS